MALFRVQLADQDRRLKADLKASSEDLARVAAQEWFDGARWRVVDVRRITDCPIASAHVAHWRM
jgi:hypothetical protein